MSTMEITFPGGLAVDARYRGHTVHTDQPERAGGDDSGPAPFDLFLASIGTCAGFYALRFCQQRELSTEGLGLTLETERNPETGGIAVVRLLVDLPDAFPEKYRDAILRSMDQCAVKRHLVEPPEIALEVREPEMVEVT